MDIRNSMEGLRSLLGVASSPTATVQTGKSGAPPKASGLGSDLATLSSAASEMAQSTANDGVRMEKVAQVQQALAAGTYQAPVRAVASSLVDAMLSGTH